MIEVNMDSKVLNHFKMNGSVCVIKGKMYLSNPSWYMLDEDGKLFIVDETELPEVIQGDVYYSAASIVRKLNKINGKV